jgi:DNA modification methylase
LQSEIEAPEEYPLTKVKLDDLVFDKSNPNRPSKEVIEGIRKSILEFGLVKPIVINEKMEIADGEHRALVWKALGKTDIQAYIVPKLNDDIKRRLARQTLNKLQGEHDLKLDADEMALIFQAGKLDDLAELIAKDQRELKQAITQGRPDLQFEIAESTEELDQLIDEQMKRQAPDAQLGDIYQLGRHKIICADSSDQRSIDKLLEGKKANMSFTDPPYFIMGSSTGFTQDHQDDAMVRPFFKNVLQILRDNLAANAHVYICCNWRSFPTYYQLNTAIGMIPRNLIVWSKPNARLGGFYSSSHEFILFLSNDPDRKFLTEHGNVRRVNGDTNVWIQSIDTNTVRDHFAQKPTVLMERAIKNSSDEGDLVFDPFLGSGSTLIACENTGRLCFGSDVDPHYIDVTVKRWETYTGEKAVKL